MNACLSAVPSDAGAPAGVALLGTGNVGSAVLSRLAGWQGTDLGRRLRLVHAANSRVAMSGCDGIDVASHKLLFRDAAITSSLDAVEDALAGSPLRIVIDATASDIVADRHAGWLAAGVHVVTANKLGQGASLARWHQIRAACERGGSCYGDSATVGAGLPLLRTLRELRAGGDRIHAITGVLSGSMAWLCNHFDSQRPFSEFVRQARAAGYTEPDPREDLSGADVRRKLLILARSAGFELEAGDVEVVSLVPAGLAAVSGDDVDAALPLLDAPLRAHFVSAFGKCQRLRFIARLEDGCARVGLEALPLDHPLAGGAGNDNCVAIWSDRYRTRPVLVQGPGAGAGVTAAALLDDALVIQAGAAGPRYAQPGAEVPKNTSIGCGRWNT